MASLQNLIFDPSTENVLQCRPASIELLANRFPNPILSFGFVSVFKIVGDVLYGLANSRLNPGHDQPFAFNLLTGTSILVTGVTGANTPLSPATSGAWTPPTMDVIGTKLIVTHPGFTLPNAFGWFDISVPLAPTWNAGNTATTPLAAPATAVVQFNGRAYYLVNPPGAQPGLYASDVLDPLTMTDPTFILTFGDNELLTALAGLPLNNQLGGIIQSAIVFKGASIMYQVTGDPAANTAAGPWTKNALNVATGTLAPRSVAPSPLGLMFMSPQGLRTIGFTAQVSPPLGANGKGISTPFIGAPTPSRMAVAANASILRASVTDANGQQREFWYDMTRSTWTGPHTFPATMIAPYKNTFILAPLALPNSIWQSDWLQDADSTFNEAGSPLTWAWQPSMLTDVRDMQEHEQHETVVLLSTATGAQAVAANENGNVIASASVAPTLAGNWSDARWQGSMYFKQVFALPPTRLAWDQTIVFGRLTLQITGVSDSMTRIGALTMRYEQLGNLPQPGL